MRGGHDVVIVGNGFLKREFSRKLIEEVLPKQGLTHVIDTSRAYSSGHGTPTVILFGRRWTNPKKPHTPALAVMRNHHPERTSQRPSLVRRRRPPLRHRLRRLISLLNRS